MAYGWSTTKTFTGDSYYFRVYAIEYGQPTRTLDDGIRATRARAVAAAKKAVMKYRSKASRGASENSLGIY
jgi:hypothetical protein